MHTTLRVNPADLGDMPLFSTTEAEARGIPRRDLAIMVRRELIWRVARGWYSSRMDATEEERHVLRALAVVRSQTEAAVACHHTAVLLHGMPLARADLDVVHIARPDGGHGRTREGVRFSQIDPGLFREVEVVDRVTGRTVTVVDPASAIVGTAMSNNPLAALVAGDHALRLGLCTREQIDSAVSSRHGHKGIGAARDVLHHLEPRHESPGETLTAAALRRGQWAFEPQLTVMGRSGRAYRLDFALKEYRLAIEFDGACKYTGPDVMEEQLAREADLRAVGWEFVRVVWGDFDDEETIRRAVVDAVRLLTAAA